MQQTTEQTRRKAQTLRFPGLTQTPLPTFKALHNVQQSAMVQGRHDAEAALRKAQEERAAQAESTRQLQQQLAAADRTPAAENQASSPAG